MLTQLTISNFAIIDELEINFKDGLTVLTGETGAGKSIIADALDFLFTSRASSELMKNGTNKTLVEGIFLTSDFVFNKKIGPWLEKNDFEVNEDKNLLIISRELTNYGSKARINGTVANVSQLSYLKEYLIDIHEQSEHIELLKSEKQLAILDGFGSESHRKLIEEYKKLFEEYNIIKSRLNYFLEHSASLAKKLDFLEFEVQEIKSAGIKNLNEENELVSQREILVNKQELIENTNIIYELISSENQNNILSTLSQIKKLITKSSEYDKTFEPYLETLENMIDQIKDLSSFAKNYHENVDEEKDILNNIEQRLDLFYKLKKKYGKSLQEVIEYLKKSQIELSELKKDDNSQEGLERTFKEKELEINALGEKLTKSREKVTKDFVDKVNEELSTLGFKQVIFVVQFIDCELCRHGKEQIQFLFTANPDEPPKPLLKVASGGELSRIMLAIKSTASAQHGKDVACNVSAPTMIFDEIDMGVSGEIASSVAKKLYKISRQNQVISITHQPIICAMADTHIVVEKKLIDGNTSVDLREISQSEKAEALATLLTPDKKLKDGVTEDAKHFAKSLLENARKIKEKELIRN